MNPSKLEYLLRGTPLYPLLVGWIDRIAIRDWARTRRPPAPRLVKQQLVSSLGRRNAYATLVETGTFYGDMIEAVRESFATVVSIELSPRLHARALRRFAGVHGIELILGDSSTQLPSVLARLDAPALFWLDGHFSGAGTARGPDETPIRDEIAAIVRHPVEHHLVLVDDARLFGADPAYPSVADVERVVKESKPGWTIVLLDDVLRIGRPDRVAP